MQPGDVIFIPNVDKTVGIAGEVRRPAIYELLENEKKLSSLLEYAGGLKPTANRNTAQIQETKNQEPNYKETRNRITRTKTKLQETKTRSQETNIKNKAKETNTKEPKLQKTKDHIAET